MKKHNLFSFSQIHVCAYTFVLQVHSMQYKTHYPLTLSLLPFLDYSIQPLLFIFGSLGHTDKPLVFGCVVNLPTICHRVAIAVVICCKRPKHKAHSEQEACSFNQTSVGHFQ